MSYLLPRPSVDFDPANGLLRAEHFQIAYATNDIDRACALFRERLGIREFRRLEGPLKSGGEIRVELTWVGSVMYELMTASGPGSDIYAGRLPSNEGFALKHHHLGYLIHNAVQWDAMLTEAGRNNWPVPHISDNAGFMKSCFVEIPELGHYLECIWPETAGIKFFENVPRS